MKVNHDRHWIRALPIFFIGTLLFGCSSPMLQVKPPPAVDAETSAEITVARQGDLTKVRQWVILDGDVVAYLDNKEYTRFSVKPGQHTVGLVCFYPSHYFNQIVSGSGNDGETYIELDLGAGESACLMSSVGLFSCAKLEKKPLVCDSIDEYKFSKPGRSPEE